MQHANRSLLPPRWLCLPGRFGQHARQHTKGGLWRAHAQPLTRTSIVLGNAGGRGLSAKGMDRSIGRSPAVRAWVQVELLPAKAGMAQQAVPTPDGDECQSGKKCLE